MSFENEVAKQVSQSDRVLGILSDGFAHSPTDFTGLTRPILSYTKIISLLRKQGHNIQKERRSSFRGTKYWVYRLKGA